MIRDPAVDQCVRLPMVGRDELVSGYTMDALLNNPALNRVHTRYHLQVCQPESIAREYEEADLDLGRVRMHGAVPLRSGELTSGVR